MGISTTISLKLVSLSTGFLVAINRMGLGKEMLGASTWKRTRYIFDVGSWSWRWELVGCGWENEINYDKMLLVSKA